MLRKVISLLSFAFAVNAVAADPYDMMLTGQCFDSRWGYYGAFGGVLANGNLQSFDTSVDNLAQAPGNRVFGMHDRDVVEVLPDSSVVPLVPNASDIAPLHMVVSANGTIYLLPENGQLRVIAPNGDTRTIALSPSQSTDRGNDLASDQCTLYYLDSPGIKRFNVCTETPLPDFAAVSFANDVRVLPDGGVLVATFDGLLRFNAAGQLTRTYDVTKVKAIGLTNGGTTAILAHACRSRTGEQAGEENNLERVDLQSGEVTTIPFDHYGGVDIVPYRGWTAALGSANMTDVPTVSTAAALFLGALITFAAFMRLR